MRKPILLFLVAVPGCGDGMAAPDAVIADFIDNAATLACRPADLDVTAAVTEVRRASDSTWTLLDEAQLQLLTFSDDLRLLARTPLPRTGPGAATHPVSAGLLGDSAVVVASRSGLRLVFLSPDGGLRKSVPLDFIPNALATTGSGDVLLTPLPFGARPPSLLMRYTGTEWQALPVPRRGYEDMSVNALGNAALVEPFPDGRALVVHQFLRPRAFLIDAAGRVEATTPPTPDGTRDDIGYVPRPPLTTEQLGRTLVPAIALSIDPVRAEAYLLTRSGRVVDGRRERALLRTSDRLEFREGFIVPVHAVAMVYLPRRGAALVVDDTDRFHLCPIPAPAPRTRSAR